MTATAPTCQRQHPAVCCANFLSMCLHGRRYRASTCHALTLLLSTLVTMRSCDLINAYLFSSFSLLITSNWNAFLNSYFSLYIQRYFVYTLNVCVYGVRWSVSCQLYYSLFHLRDFVIWAKTESVHQSLFCNCVNYDYSKAVKRCHQYAICAYANWKEFLIFTPIECQARHCNWY